MPVVLYLIFHKQLEGFLSIVLVRPFLSEIGPSATDDWIFLAVAVYIFLLFITRTWSFVPSVKAWFIQLIFALAYIYYRFHPAVWVFHHLHYTEKLFYADILLEITFLNGLLILLRLFKLKPVNGKSGFYDDSPLGETKKDDLGYETYVKSLVTKISNTQSDSAIAIGINGKWGSGKTSFFDLMKRNMKSDRVVVINFDPWNSHSPKAIIKDFFDTIQKAIRPYHTQLPGLINTYTDKLISLHSEGWGKFSKELKSILIPDESLNALYEEINSSLKAIDKKIIIYIDDLDRLDKDEIAEVIRLVRNTANFNNTFFIVAYDRNYVLSAIKALNAHNHTHFLEKIFQIEVNLPYFDSAKIQRKLADTLKSYYAADYHNAIENEIMGTGSSQPNYFEGWIETLRDVTRLSNGLILNLDNLVNEVVFSEFLRLEILRLKFPAVYEVLYKQSGTFLTTEGKNVEGYGLKTIADERGSAVGLTKDDFELELYLKNNSDNLAVEAQEIRKIIELIDGIFGTSPLTARFRSHLSIVFPSRFDLYFSYRLLDGALSEMEFSTARKAGLTSFKLQIDKWNEAGLTIKVLSRFIQVRVFDNRQDFETIVEAIFYFSRQVIDGKPFGFEEMPLSNLLSDDSGHISKKFYDDNQDDYANFLRRLFKEAVSPYRFEAKFLEHLNKSYEDSFPIKKEERLSMVLDYFRNYVAQLKKWDSGVWELFYSCAYKDWTPVGANTFNGTTVYSEESKEIIISAMEQHLKSFLNFIIVDAPYGRGGHYISEIIVTIFGSYERFGEFLNTTDDKTDGVLAEFKEFYGQLAAGEFKKAVPFKFKKIKPITRSGN
ncbi:hypothetical protein G7092_05865 [Mucilaginibacter sp. HC2]|nr:hypothetical protein [Mucilaginibacter inviolabilis]